MNELLSTNNQVKVNYKQKRPLIKTIQSVNHNVK